MKHMDINKQIGIKLRQLRKEKGLSMRLALVVRNEYGVKLDPSYLSRMERGRVEIPLRTLLALSDYYQVSPGWFFQEEESGERLGPPPEGTEYLLASPEFFTSLEILRRQFGEEKIKSYLAEWLERMLGLIETTQESAGKPEVIRAELDRYIQDQKSGGAVENVKGGETGVVEIGKGKQLA